MVKRLKKAVKIRVVRDRLEALHFVCSDMLKLFTPEDETELLVLEYLKELHHVLSKKLEANQGIYTIHMSGTEATAFRYLWKVLDIKDDKYACIVINGILKQIDKYTEQQIMPR
jgi:MoaA/NifB/PqqE/SkfB family radical SAM enzyme